MYSETINYFIENLWWIFSLFIFIMPYLIKFLFKRKFNSVEIINIAATLGILGTFIGIFFGLQAFDVNNIQGSIPEFLEGLRMAFASSIVGMSVGLIIKFFPIIYLIKNEDNYSTKDKDTIIINTLSDISKNISSIKISNEEIYDFKSELENIRKSISGDEDSTLLTQLQKLRMIFSDKQDELISEFKEFARQVAENSTKAFIEALTKVIEDFNTKINEQFGDNFKQLNEAVKNMLDWQAQYKNHVRELEENYKKLLTSMEKTWEIMNEVIERAKIFSKVAEDLNLTTENIKSNNRVLQSNLENFAKLGEKASETLPQVVETVDKLTIDFSNKVKDSLSKAEDIFETFKSSINEQLSQVKSFNSSVSEKLEASIKETNKKLAKQIEEFDKQLGEELKKSLSSLGSGLASLSNKFVEDYAPLTEKLQNIVEISKNIKY